MECTTSIHKASKRVPKLNSPAEVRAHSQMRLKMMDYVGMNPYKVVELWKNYRDNVPPEFHENALYAEPTAAQWAKVKVEKSDRSEFRATQKAKKYAAKERVESLAFDGDGGF